MLTARDWLPRTLTLTLPPVSTLNEAVLGAMHSRKKSERRSVSMA
jgi:hypothetical protein